MRRMEVSNMKCMLFVFLAVSTVAYADSQEGCKKYISTNRFEDCPELPLIKSVSPQEITFDASDSLIKAADEKRSSLRITMTNNSSKMGAESFYVYRNENGFPKADQEAMKEQLNRIAGEVNSELFLYSNQKKMVQLRLHVLTTALDSTKELQEIKKNAELSWETKLSETKDWMSIGESIGDKYCYDKEWVCKDLYLRKYMEVHADPEKRSQALLKKLKKISGSDLVAEAEHDLSSSSVIDSPSRDSKKSFDGKGSSKPSSSVERQ